MRLIDADVLRDRLQALAYDDWNQGVTTSWADAYSEFADMVEEMPTAQPEIIRCKDCRYSVDEYDDGDCYCKKSCSWHGANWDFYCAAAERREE